MPTPRLSRVCCEKGRVVSLLAVVNWKAFPPILPNLLYSPAGKSQVLMAARMITTIRMEIGAGKELLIAMVDAAI